MPLSVIVVEDDEALARSLGRQLKRLGAEVELAHDLRAGRLAISQRRFDAALVDVGLPDGKGSDLLGEVPASMRPALIVMTGEATVDVAVDALRLGAIDFLLKPFSLEALSAALARVMATTPGPAGTALDEAGAEGWRQKHAPAMIGTHPSLMRVFDMLARVSDTDGTILIQGETGTGKELVARAIHSASGRSAKPFLALNCAAIPETLIESELFGHAKGAFTGAASPQIGRFQAADGGTLFLDEIGEMPLVVQAKLLRALQEKEITPVGQSRSVKVDVRIVAATHRVLEEMVDARQFRQDLLYRLDVLRVELPPLRERASDVPALVAHMLKATNERRGRHVEGVEAEVLGALSSYAWPGNVRQLENVIERMVLLSQAPKLGLADLPRAIRDTKPAVAAPPGSIDTLARPILPEGGLDLREAVERFETALIEQALERSSGNRSRAALLLRMNRTTLVEKLRKRGMLDEEAS